MNQEQEYQVERDYRRSGGEAFVLIIAALVILAVGIFCVLTT